MFYAIHYPRNFSNEYSVYAGTTAELETLRTVLDRADRYQTGNFSRITRKRAIQMGWSRPREAKRDGEQWYGGFAGPRLHDPCYAADSLADGLASAHQATLDEIEYAEMMMENAAAMADEDLATA